MDGDDEEGARDPYYIRTSAAGSDLRRLVAKCDDAFFVADPHGDFPALPGAKVYQLWVMTSSGAARSAGLLVVTGSGTAAPVLASGVLPGDRLGITVEPAGGTAQPTTAPVVIMPVTA